MMVPWSLSFLILKLLGVYLLVILFLWCCPGWVCGCGFGGGIPWRWSALLISSHQGICGVNMPHYLCCQLWSSARWCLSNFPTVKLLFPFPDTLAVRSGSLCPVYTVRQGKWLHLLLEGGVSKNLWIYVKTITVINKYFGTDTLRLYKYPVSLIRFFQKPFLHISFSLPFTRIPYLMNR